MSSEPFVSRAKALPAKRSEKGYGDENVRNDQECFSFRACMSPCLELLMLVLETQTPWFIFACTVDCPCFEFTVNASVTVKGILI